MIGPLTYLSPHFVANWERRVGGRPTLAMVRALMRSAIKVQHCKDLVDAAGEACRQLAVYWHPELEIIFTIDHITETAVSVLSKECRRWKLSSGGSTNGAGRSLPR